MAEQISIIDQILANTDPKVIVNELTIDDEYIAIAKTNQDEYDGVHKVLLRQDKKIGEGSNAKTVPVARLVVSFQKTITNLAVAFLFGRPIKYVMDSEDNTQDAFTSMQDLFRQKKMEYFDRKIARRVMIETRCAELWYATNETFNKDEPKAPDDPGYVASKIGVMLLSKETGYEIFPYFDQFGDMVAFTMKYSGKIYDKTTKKVMSQNYIKVFTSAQIITYVQTGSGIAEESREPNPFGKIPVIYYEQDQAEWKDVQTLIDRYEDHISHHADENDYYASPILKIKGKIVKPPEKDQTGKVLQFDSQMTSDGKSFMYGDAEYLTWDQAPESLKLEGSNLKDLIYSLTSTPDVSFTSVKGISNISGIALKLLFFDATLKAMNHQEVFGEGISRRVNLVKQILSITNVAIGDAINNLQVTVKFQDPTPQDIKEAIETLTEGMAGKPVMSRQTALRNNPLVVDAKDEAIEMDEDEKRNTDDTIIKPGSFNI